MNIIATTDLTLPRCDHMSRNCDCEADAVFPLRLHGQVHFRGAGFDVELVAVDGLPDGMELSDLSPDQEEALLVELEAAAKGRIEFRRQVLSKLELVLNEWAASPSLIKVRS